jgi:hypothetical protein
MWFGSAAHAVVASGRNTVPSRDPAQVEAFNILQDVNVFRNGQWMPQDVHRHERLRQRL